MLFFIPVGIVDVVFTVVICSGFVAVDTNNVTLVVLIGTDAKKNIYIKRYQAV